MQPATAGYDPELPATAGVPPAERTGSDRLRPAAARHSLCGMCAVALVSHSTTTARLLHVGSELRAKKRAVIHHGVHDGAPASTVSETGSGGVMEHEAEYEKLDQEGSYYDELLRMGHVIARVADTKAWRDEIKTKAAPTRSR